VLHPRDRGAWREIVRGSLGRGCGCRAGAQAHAARFRRVAQEVAVGEGGVESEVDELFEDVVGRVLLGSRLSSNNPFQF
jgi:hypothetical protein